MYKAGFLSLAARNEDAEVAYVVTLIGLLALSGLIGLSASIATHNQDAEI